VIALLLFLTAAESPDNWPQFRGPDSMGVAEDPRLPDTWSATDNVVWRTAVPGRGWSSPIVWGDHIFLTSVASDTEHGAPKTGLYSGGPQDIPGGEHRWLVLGLDWATGKIVWEREVHRGRPSSARHLKNSYKVLGRNSLDEVALATPAIARGSLLIRTATKLYRIAKTTP